MDNDTMIRQAAARRAAPTEPAIKIHGPAEFEAMRAAGKLAAETLDFITPHVVPGVTTEALDKLCHDFIVDHDAVPAPLNYRGFPKSICTSINHVVCHGIPGPKQLRDGDIVNIDVTVILDGWHGDTSRMFLPGRQREREGAASLVDDHLRGHDARHCRACQAGGDPGRHRPCHSVAIAEDPTASPSSAISAATASAGSSTMPRRACSTTATRVTGMVLKRGHVLHRRADDQRRPHRT